MDSLNLHLSWEADQLLSGKYLCIIFYPNITHSHAALAFIQMYRGAIAFSILSLVIADFNGGVLQFY